MNLSNDQEVEKLKKEVCSLKSKVAELESSSLAPHSPRLGAVPEGVAFSFRKRSIGRKHSGDYGRQNPSPAPPQLQTRARSISDAIRSPTTTPSSTDDKHLPSSPSFGSAHSSIAPAGEGLTIHQSSMHILDGFLEAVRKISNEQSAQSVANMIIEETCSLLRCERATLFFVDDENNELVLLVARGADEIRVPIGTGVAGYVAEHGVTLNIPNAYNDDRFNSNYDKASGFKTRTLLTTPVRDFHGEVVAVLQAVNKESGEGFTQLDEILMENLAAHVGVSLRNAQLYEETVVAREQMASLLDVVRMLHSDPNVHSLIFTLRQRAAQLVSADKCSIFVADHKSQQLILMESDSTVDIRLPINKGIAGHVASTGEVLNIADAYDDERFNPEFDKKNGYRTCSILAMPIRNPEKKVIGVLQLINKLDYGEFTAEDEDMMATLLHIAGSIMAKSKLFQSVQRESESDAVLDLTPDKSLRRLRSPAGLSLNMATLEEGDEDDPDN